VKSGKGTYQWADGSKYEGDWLNNKLEGQVDLSGNLLLE